jgi:hypothetical protein
MYQELRKLLDAKIIFQVRHSTWVANLVPVRKKSGEIRLCVDFRNLNRASEKDNYPIPPMEKLLQTVSGSVIFSLLDGFSGYNQVLVSEEDRLKTTFRTKWGTFAYKRMPFGLINVGATFQRAMDVDFRGLINKCVVVYLDDVTVYSKNREEHIQHLTQIFERCRKYGISLNPKKTIFGVEEGKLLGHVISQAGIHIDPERIKSIAQLPLPHNKKAMQSFFGQINFVRKFTPDFAEIIKPLQKMIHKDVEFKWDDERKNSFNNIKAAISRAPVLRSPDFNKDFNLYTFASDQSLAAVLTQKDDDNNEAPVSFMSTNLQGVELNYPTIDKQAYAVYKAVKHFRSYILKNHTKVIVPHPAVRSLFTQQEMGERRGNWMAVVQEFDLDIKPAKLVKGQGLCKLAAEAQDQVNEDPGWENEITLWCGEATYISPG